MAPSISKRAFSAVDPDELEKADNSGEILPVQDTTILAEDDGPP